MEPGHKKWGGEVEERGKNRRKRVGMENDIEKRASIIAEAVVGLTNSEWSRIKVAIDKKFSSASSKVKLEDTEELKRAIQLEF